MTHTPVDKNKNYSGPRFFTEIIQAISDDAKTEGRNISYDDSHRILYFFFSVFNKQIFKTSFHFEGLGFFKRLTKKHFPHRKSKLALYKARRKRQAAKNHIMKIAKAKVWYKRFMKFNKLRREKGHREWSWAHYCSIKKITPLKAYQQYVLKSRIKFF